MSFGNDPSHASSGGWRSVLLALRFATELALLAALVIVGINAGGGTAAKLALAVGAPVAAAAIWGLGIAPRAKRRWPDPWRLAAEIVLFGAASAGLIIDTSAAAGIAFAVVTIGTALALRPAVPAG